MNIKLVVFVVAVLLVLILATQARKSVRAELIIEASPDDIWAVLTDPSSYPNWNPILVTVEGDFIEGRKVNVGMKNPDGSITEVRPLVRRVVPNAEINQFGGMTGILTFDHTWSLEAVEGGTRVTQFEQYRGVGVLFWDPAWVQGKYVEGNENLRDLLRPESKLTP